MDKIEIAKSIEVQENHLESEIEEERHDKSNVEEIDKGLNSELILNNEKLVEFMNREEPFLKADLSLNDLSESLGFSRHQLSNVINQCHEMNFYEFINSYRVEKVKGLMKDPANSNLKMMSIAYDAGFNSKASFNRIFKQITKMTPTQYYSSIRTNEDK